MFKFKYFIILSIFLNVKALVGEKSAESVSSVPENSKNLDATRRPKRYNDFLHHIIDKHARSADEQLEPYQPWSSYRPYDVQVLPYVLTQRTGNMENLFYNQPHQGVNLYPPSYGPEPNVFRSYESSNYAPLYPSPYLPDMQHPMSYPSFSQPTKPSCSRCRLLKKPQLIYKSEERIRHVPSRHYKFPTESPALVVAKEKPHKSSTHYVILKLEDNKCSCTTCIPKPSKCASKADIKNDNAHTALKSLADVELGAKTVFKSHSEVKPIIACRNPLISNNNSRPIATNETKASQSSLKTDGKSVFNNKPITTAEIPSSSQNTTGAFTGLASNDAINFRTESRDKTKHTSKVTGATPSKSFNTSHSSNEVDDSSFTAVLGSDIMFEEFSANTISRAKATGNSTTVQKSKTKTNSSAQLNSTSQSLRNASKAVLVSKLGSSSSTTSTMNSKFNNTAPPGPNKNSTALNTLHSSTNSSKHSNSSSSSIISSSKTKTSTLSIAKADEGIHANKKLLKSETVTNSTASKSKATSSSSIDTRASSDSASKAVAKAAVSQKFNSSHAQTNSSSMSDSKSKSAAKSISTLNENTSHTKFATTSDTRKVSETASSSASTSNFTLSHSKSNETVKVVKKTNDSTSTLISIHSKNATNFASDSISKSTSSSKSSSNVDTTNLKTNSTNSFSKAASGLISNLNNDSSHSKNSSSLNSRTVSSSKFKSSDSASIKAANTKDAITFNQNSNHAKNSTATISNSDSKTVSISSTSSNLNLTHSKNSSNTNTSLIAKARSAAASSSNLHSSKTKTDAGVFNAISNSSSTLTHDDSSRSVLASDLDVDSVSKTATAHKQNTTHSNNSSAEFNDSVSKATSKSGSTLNVKSLHLENASNSSTDSSTKTNIKSTVIINQNSTHLKIDTSSLVISVSNSTSRLPSNSTLGSSSSKDTTDARSVLKAESAENRNSTNFNSGSVSKKATVLTTTNLNSSNSNRTSNTASIKNSSSSSDSRKASISNSNSTNFNSTHSNSNSVTHSVLQAGSRATSVSSSASSKHSNSSATLSKPTSNKSELKPLRLVEDDQQISFVLSKERELDAVEGENLPSDRRDIVPFLKNLEKIKNSPQSSNNSPKEKSKANLPKQSETLASEVQIHTENKNSLQQRKLNSKNSNEGKKLDTNFKNSNQVKVGDNEAALSGSSVHNNDRKALDTKQHSINDKHSRKPKTQPKKDIFFDDILEAEILRENNPILNKEVEEDEPEQRAPVQKSNKPFAANGKQKSLQFGSESSRRHIKNHRSNHDTLELETENLKFHRKNWQSSKPLDKSEENFHDILEFESRYFKPVRNKNCFSASKLYPAESDDNNRGSWELETGNTEDNYRDKTKTGSRFVFVLKPQNRKLSSSSSRATFAEPLVPVVHKTKTHKFDTKSDGPLSIYWHKIERKPHISDRHLKQLQPFQSEEFEDIHDDHECLDTYDSNEREENSEIPKLCACSSCLT